MSAGVQPAAAPPRRSWQRRVLRMLGLVAGTYLGIILVLLALENSLVYHPIPASVEWWPPPGPEVRDVYLTTADGTRIHAWWYPKEGADGALLYFHGNAGNLSHRGPTIAVLRQELGVSVLIVDYPGFGRSDGSPSEAGCCAAADVAYAWLTRIQKVPAEKVLIYGSSLGGGVAVDLASRCEHRALILTKTFTSMPDVGQGLYPWLPVRWLMRNRYESLAKIERCKRPVFIAHGTADRLIPFAHGERLYAAANEPKQFHAMQGVDHNAAWSAGFFPALRDFLSKAEAVKR
jgi:fermentation-respiration switch protein FrsA (DUF1100 family)